MTWKSACFYTLFNSLTDSFSQKFVMQYIYRNKIKLMWTTFCYLDITELSEFSGWIHPVCLPHSSDFHRNTYKENDCDYFCFVMNRQFFNINVDIFLFFYGILLGQFEKDITNNRQCFLISLNIITGFTCNIELLE